MRLRIIIFVLALLTFFSVSTGGWLYYYSLKKAALDVAERSAENRLELLRRQLSSALSEHTRPVEVLSRLKELRYALESDDPEALEQVNSILDNFADSLNLEESYLMNSNGITIASSNRNNEDSFVGKDFSFRYYFQKALTGVPAKFLALGTTSNKRGVYFSHPVYDRTGSLILGVAVIKASVELIEAQLFADSEGVLLVMDPNGIIFISNLSEIRFMSLWQLTQEQIDEVAASKQFGEGPWAWTGFSLLDDGSVKNNKGVGYLYSAMDLIDYPGWKIVNLRSFREIAKQLSDPFIKIVGPAVLIISLLVGAAVFVLYDKALHEIIRRRKAEEKLRLSEERYRHIYHKTPVMLHSIDILGIIIRVSDHWLDTMGYTREEVIGRHLTSFFTPESREYAELTIFPEFFRTGFCKDVPYTYVKKDGSTIDILLSCYGVRNKSGDVVRSLAVSVDVTEKNSVQKDLQQAKEKLSRYSLDLEQQVEKRTAELKKVQDKLRRLSGSIMASQERERGMLARELHDQLGQVLTALRIDAVWIRNYLLKKDPDAATHAERICSLIDDTIRDVRDMAFRLRPRHLDELGLVDALESLARDFEERSTVSCVFHNSGVQEVDETLSTALYRIVQESGTNALRHSNATLIEIDLKGNDTCITLSVQDNGCGFDMDEKTEYYGFGLAGMKERAILAGGRLEIISQKGRGTRVLCSIPIGEQNHDQSSPC